MAKSGEYDDMGYGLSAPADLLDTDQFNVDTTVPDNEVPPPSVEINDVDPPIDEENSYDPKDLIKMLKESCQELGVRTEPEMINSMLAASSVYEVNPDSFRWFVLGITYSNNKRIIPSIEGLIKDMRAEIKSLQMTTSDIRTASTDITKKMVSVKDDMLEGFDKLRANVLDAVADSEARKANTARGVDEVPKEKKQGIKPADVLVSHSKPKTTKITDVPSSSTSNPVREEKIKLLVKEKAIGKILQTLTDEELEDLISDVEFAELKYGSDETTKEIIKDDILLRLAEADILNFG
ncbi:phosphoprotein [Daphne virus 1]|nr:phosphoprotein [Daphne virus 1]